MGATFGIHWITTTHGTWLHGDPRGSWRDGKLIGPDPFLEQTIRQRMAHDAVVLSDMEIMLVASSFGATVTEQRWRVYAATIQSTHAHLVIAPLREPIKRVIATLKYRSAREVKSLRRNTRRPMGRSVWTAGQFPVFIFDTSHLHNAIEYVRRHNMRMGRAADPYDWVTPLNKPTPEGSAI